MHSVPVPLSLASPARSHVIIFLIYVDGAHKSEKCIVHHHTLLHHSQGMCGAGEKGVWGWGGGGESWGPLMSVSAVRHARSILLREQ